PVLKRGRCYKGGFIKPELRGPLGLREVGILDGVRTTRGRSGSRRARVWRTPDVESIKRIHGCDERSGCGRQDVIETPPSKNLTQRVARQVWLARPKRKLVTYHQSQPAGNVALCQASIILERYIARNGPGISGYSQTPANGIDGFRPGISQQC